MKKKLTIGIISVSLAAGGLFGADQAINPYTETAEKYGLAVQQMLPEMGEAKIEVSKSEPAVTFSKWNDEVAMTVKYGSVKAAGARQLLTDRVEWQNGGKEEMHAYPLPPGEGMEDGGFEIEIVLTEKPLTHVFEFTIEGAENLDFFYQPELTQEEIDEGVERPENVVGSYAVYHKTKVNHRRGSTNYATGKAFHIYRPKAIDANGAEVWAELSYVNGVLSVTVPQNFLDGAMYPVRVDPTFGYTTLGATGGITICTVTSDTSTHAGDKWVLSENGTLNSISIGVDSTSAEQSVDMFLAIYDEDSAGIDSHDRVASVETLNLTISTTAAFYEIAATSEALTADTFILAGLCNGADMNAGNIVVMTDAGGPSNRFYSETSTGASSYATRKAENPWTEVDANSTNQRSIYATYTASGGAPAIEADPARQNVIWIDSE